MLREEKNQGTIPQQKQLLEERMLRQGQHITIKELYSTGMAKREIARLLGIDAKTVRRHLKKTEWTAYQREERNNKLLSRHKEWLSNRMGEVRYNARVLYQELQLFGYEGSYETVKDFIRPYRVKREEASVRYETAPGEQSQVDWGSCFVWLGERRTKVHFFVYTLGFSRRVFARGYSHEKLVNLIDGHERAFRWFGGYTSKLLYDNPRTMVDSHDELTGQVILNKKFEDFVRYYGFRAQFCRPYRAQTKGKVESGVKYIKGNFLAGRRFRDLDHLNEELERWILEIADQRIHGTTHQKPIDRFAQETLIPLYHTQPYQLHVCIHRKVSQDSRISFQNNRYSVPWTCVGQLVDLKVCQGEVVIINKGTEIARHPLLQGKYQESVLKQHFEGLFRAVARQAIKPPLHDPRWREGIAVGVRDLSVYEKAAQGGESCLILN